MPILITKKNYSLIIKINTHKMTSNNLTVDTKDNYKLSDCWENHSVFQGIFTRVLFQFLLLVSMILTTYTVEAMPIITNTATANFTINGNNIILSDSEQFTKDTVVIPTDSINLIKSASTSSAAIGETITYILTLQNPNPRVLNNVSIQDSLPAGLTYIANSAQLNGTVINTSQISSSGNTLLINMGSFPANFTWNISYQTNISETTPIGNAVNTAIASSDTATSSPAQASVIIEAPLVPLVLSKHANKSEVKIGENISYTLTIKNDNTNEILNAIANDQLPIGLTFVPGSALLNGNPVLVDNTNGLSFLLGTIDASSTATLTYGATVNTPIDNSRSLINTANVITEDEDANSNTSSVTVNIVNDVLLLTKSTTSTNVTAGEVVNYTLTLTNPTNRGLNKLNIIDSLPDGFTYVVGSAAVNSNSQVLNNVTADGNNLNFNISSVIASTSVVICYQVTVTENAKPGNAINTAVAASDFGESLTVTAVVKVRTPSTIKFLKIDDDGLSSTIQSTLFNTNTDGGKNFEDVPTITLPDGSTIDLPDQQPIIIADQYTVSDPIVIEVTDLDQNLDSETLETIIVTVNIPGTNDTEILLLTETSADSGIFRGIIMTTTDSTKVQDGILTIADGVTISVSYLDDEDSTDTSASAALVVPDTSLEMIKTADKDYSALGELVRYTLEFKDTTGFSLRNLKVHDLLPLGFRYIPNTAELNGDRLNDNVSFDGRFLTFDLINMPDDSTWTISYVTKVSAGVQFGDAINTAYFTNGTIRSNTAQAIVNIKDDLMRSKNILTGRVYIGCKTKANKNEKPPEVLSEARIYLETGRSVLTDAEGFWHMEGVNPGAHVVQLDTESIPGYVPLLCNDNTRRARDAKSHFVDLQAGNLWHVDFHVSKIEGYTKTQDSLRKKPEVKDPFKLFNKEYLKQAPEGFDILWPANNYVPPIGSTNIFVKHSPQQKVEVILNGKKISPINYDGSETNKARTVVIKRWKGVDIDINRTNNTLLVILKDKSGNELKRKTHNIHFSSSPASASYLKQNQF